MAIVDIDAMNVEVHVPLLFTTSVSLGKYLVVQLLGCSTEDHRRREGKLKGGKSERETNHERLWTLGNKLRISEGRGLGAGVTG